MKAAGAMINICRAYAAICAAGVRVLVDRVWTCDLSKVVLRRDDWIREAATNRWFYQYYAYWSEFLTRYAAEFGHTSQAAERGLVWCVNGQSYCSRRPDFGIQQRGGTARLPHRIPTEGT